MQNSNVIQMHGRKKTSNDPQSPLDFLGTVADFLDEKPAINEYC